MKVCIGGTFDILHAGHMALLKKAFEIGSIVYIGLSSDEFVRKSGKEAKPYEERKKALEEFLSSKGWKSKAFISPLDSVYGTTPFEDFDAIVVSPETVERAREINDIRRRNGLKELKIYVVPFVLANDGIPISSSRIKNGEIDGRKRVKPMKVCIATKNEIKVEAVKQVFDELFDFEIFYERVAIQTKKQPFGREIFEGAVKRASSCKNCDYCIGIEAGIEKQHGIHFIGQIVVIKDEVGFTTYGKSPYFQCPDWLIEEIKKGKEMKEAIPFEKGEESKGAIWYFSHKMDRLELTKLGIFMAMLPRLTKNF